MSIRLFLDESNLSKFQGCFADSPNQRFLNGFKYNFSGLNSVEFCVQACFRAGFEYAGVEFQSECFCGNFFNGLLPKNAVILENEKCRKYYCDNSTTTTEFCGGFNAIAVYSTGVKSMFIKLN